ncbi:hypothetical protein [Halococcus sp. IIIV-5B]|uniref:hypothetical protein n=1 Tax=Halococcus sp. IIIV-5B TaxID=2321230 RepID=UPI000E732C80|nr:hypothetical protein [Halococcus sp. IIIV-5B]RJT07998.1 hypothetical protein D3261_01250 [Halococcus sp. IIIV-5B]
MSSLDSWYDDGRLDREAILSILSDQLHRIDDRLSESDLASDDVQKQEIRIKWLRTLATLSGEYRKLMKDSDMDEFEEDLELLQKAEDINR